MKNIPLLSIVLALLLWSCGADNDNSNGQDVVDLGSGTITIDGKTWEFPIVDLGCFLYPDGSFAFRGGKNAKSGSPYFEVILYNYLASDSAPPFTNLSFAQKNASQTGFDYLYGTDPELEEDLGSYFQLNGMTITGNPPMLQMAKPGFDPSEGFVEVESSLTVNCKDPHRPLTPPPR